MAGLAMPFASLQTIGNGIQTNTVAVEAFLDALMQGLIHTYLQKIRYESIEYLLALWISIARIRVHSLVSWPFKAKRKGDKDLIPPKEVMVN